MNELELGEIKGNSLEEVVDWLLNLKDELKGALDNKKWYQKFSIRGSATKKLYEYLDKDGLFSNTKNLMDQFKGAKTKELEKELDNEEMEETLSKNPQNVTAVLPVFKGMLAERLSLIISFIYNIAKSAPKSSYLNSLNFQNSLGKVQRIISEKCRMYEERQKAIIEVVNQNNPNDKQELLKVFKNSKKAINASVKEMVKAAKKVEENLEIALNQED